MKDTDSRERCPISQTLFDCNHCDCVSSVDGLCDDMRKDKQFHKLVLSIRKISERQLLARLEKQGRLKK